MDRRPARPPAAPGSAARPGACGPDLRPGYVRAAVEGELANIIGAPASIGYGVHSRLRPMAITSAGAMWRR
jgi:hypothetical protein